MKNFTRNLSVKWRLVGFVGFLLVLIIGAALGGLNGMRSVNQSLSDVYAYHILSFEELRAIDNLFQAGIVSTTEKVLFGELSGKDAIRAVNESKADLDKKWDYLHSLGDSHTGKLGNAWIKPSKNLITETDAIAAKLIRHFENSDTVTLELFTAEELYPFAEKHRRTINFLIQDRLAAVKSTYDYSQVNFDLYKRAFILIITIGIAISILASYILIKSINTPLTKIINAMKQVVKGDLTQQLEFGPHDEFGLLIKGFNRMVTYLHDLVSQIQQSGIQVTSSITELAATNRQQEVTATEHAATTSEIAASSTEIAATGVQLLATMKKVNSLTTNAAWAAQEGQEGLTGLNATMVKMEEATGSIVTKLQILNEKAANIAAVVKTINKVADQTNLLSLNAAIEAEKAGEYGSGFAVVATEIRRLADQTAVATFDIAQIVKEVQSALSTAVMGIDKFSEETNTSVKEVHLISEQISGIIEQVEVINPQVESLTEGIEAQTQGANQISEAISQLNEAAQQSAESLTQTSASIAQLHQAALGLQESTTLFKVEPDYADAAPPV